MEIPQEMPPSREIRERWMGATLYSRDLAWREHPARNPDPVEWGGFDAYALGVGCDHQGPHCPAWRDLHAS